MPHNLDKLKRTFGAIAEQYDSVRPGYPASVIDAILALFGAETLRSTLISADCSRHPRRC